MHNQIATKKFLVLLVNLLLIFTCLLNYCSKIATCSLIFTFLTLTAYTIHELFKKKYALISLLLSIAISYTGLWNYNYLIQGSVIKGLVLVSFTSLLVSVYFGIKVLCHLNKMYPFSVRFLISLVIASGVDGIVMSGILLSNNISLSRIVLIFLKEVAYKHSYGLGIYLILYSWSYFMIKYRDKRYISLPAIGEK